MKYILDSSAVIASPQLLALNAVSLVIPVSIIDELVSRGSFDARELRREMINDALDRGVVAVDARHVGHSMSAIHNPKLSIGDLDIVKIAQDMVGEFGLDNVCVVTSDGDLIRELKRFRIKCESPQEVLASNGSRNSQIDLKAKQLVTYQWRHLVLSAFLGGAISLIVVLATSIRSY